MLHGLYHQKGTMYDFPNWKKDANGVLRQKKKKEQYTEYIQVDGKISDRNQQLPR